MPGGRGGVSYITTISKYPSPGDRDITKEPMWTFDVDYRALLPVSLHSSPPLQHSCTLSSGLQGAGRSVCMYYYVAIVHTIM